MNNEPMEFHSNEKNKKQGKNIRNPLKITECIEKNS